MEGFLCYWCGGAYTWRDLFSESYSSLLQVRIARMAVKKYFILLFTL